MTRNLLLKERFTDNSLNIINSITQHQCVFRFLLFDRDVRWRKNIFSRLLISSRNKLSRLIEFI
jgi:hypothetical protein